MLDLALLGTGGSMPIPDRYLTSLLIKYKGRNILVDCGEGTQVSMRLLKWGFKNIDIICISHRHGDHLLGLPGLLSTMGNSGRINPVTIIGPQGIKAIIQGLQLPIPNIPFEVKIIEDPRKPLNIGLKEDRLIVENLGANREIKISTLELDHSVPCLGFSFEIQRKNKFEVEKARKNKVPKKLWKSLQEGQTIKEDNRLYKSSMVLGEKRKGIKLSYIMDTRPMERIVDFIKESDLFICEGTYGDDEKLNKAIEYKHMTFREAAELAKKAKVDKLILAHFSSAMDQPEIYLENAREVFENTILGYDRMIKTLSFEDS